MFPASIKAAAAFSSSYTRGVALQMQGAVVEYSTYELEESGTCEISGKVQGSAKKPYKAWVELDLRKQVVVGHDCTCPAHSNYGGMCKHDVALALTYLNDHPVKSGKRSATSSSLADGVVASAQERLLAAIESGKLSATSNAASGKSKAASKREKKLATPPAPTSQNILLLMNASAKIALNEAEFTQRTNTVESQTKELADFSCTIAKIVDPYRTTYFGGADDTYELRLRVKCGKASYIVKRFDELMIAWEEGGVIVYGKNLTLAHTRSAFTERACKLLDFIAPIERAQRAMYYTQGRYRYGVRGTNEKVLSLTSADAIAILDIMTGTEITYEYESRYAKKKQTVQVKKGNPHLLFSMQRGEGDGWDLHVPANITYLRCEDDLYVLDGKNAWRCDADYTRRAGTLFEALFPASSDVFHVADVDVPVFCERVLPMLEAQVGFDTPDELAAFTPPEAEFSFRIGLVDDCVTCTATVAYDDVELPLFADLATDQPVRDIERELKAQRLVRTYFPNGYVQTPNYSEKVSQHVYAYSARSSLGLVAPQRKPLGLGAGPGVPWFPENDVESFYNLMSDGLAELSLVGEVLMSDKLRDIEVRQAPEMHVEVSVSNGLLDLSVDASDLSPADLMSYLASYRRKQRYVRLSSGDIMRLGEGVQALSELADGLGIADADLIGVDGTGGQLPANRTLFVDALMKDAPGVRFDRDESFRSIVRSFDTIVDSDFVEPDSLRNVLRSYQRTGFKWLSTLDALEFGGILADDMGLGKTLQIIALLLARKQQRDAATDVASTTGTAEEAAKAAMPASPSLVVCPASLVYNWTAEIERFAPELIAVPVVGPAMERRQTVANAIGKTRDARKRDTKAANAKASSSAAASTTATSTATTSEISAASPPEAVEQAPDVLITSYDLMKRDIDAYTQGMFDVVVLDEAHYIKNAATLSAKTAKRLPSRMRFALTGTPIENRLAELWSIFDFLMPGILGSRESFSRRFEKPISAGEEGVAARLSSLVSPFILRRLKADVLTDLPEKNESIVYAVMSGEQDKLYKANVERLALELSKQMPEEFAANRIAILAELTRLRQLCCDPRLAYENFTGSSAKLETCIELLSSAVESGHAVLLFSQFTSMLDLIAERLRKEKMGYLMLTGATSKEERVRLVRDFQAGAAPVFLISLKAGGVGLNLTAADIVIHYDPWWNLAAQNQATDRAHRIGQTRDVSVFKLIAKGTIEEKIVEMQEAKRDLAESVIGGAGVSSTALTRDDVLALLDL